MRGHWQSKAGLSTERLEGMALIVQCAVHSALAELPVGAGLQLPSKQGQCRLKPGTKVRVELFQNWNQ